MARGERFAGDRNTFILQALNRIQRIIISNPLCRSNIPRFLGRIKERHVSRSRRSSLLASAHERPWISHVNIQPWCPEAHFQHHCRAFAILTLEITIDIPNMLVPIELYRAIQQSAEPNRQSPYMPRCEPETPRSRSSLVWEFSLSRRGQHECDQGHRTRSNSLAGDI
jgi:hypothetical protein